MVTRVLLLVVVVPVVLVPVDWVLVVVELPELLPLGKVESNNAVR